MNIRVAQRINPQQFLLVCAVLLVLFWLAQRDVTQHYNVQSVSALRAKQLIDSGAIVVDVRGEESYGERHIPGAISIPLSSLEKAIPASIAQAKAKPMVVYCGDGVTVGPEGTSILNKAGFANAVNLQAGIQGWVDAGLPVETHGSSGA